MLVIGEIIRTELKKSRINVTEFARLINTNRNNVYDIFSRKTIDTGLLYKIGKALDHDFFQYYISDDTKLSIVNDKQNIYITNKEIKKLSQKISELEKEIEILNDRLRDKEEIITLMKKTNS